MKNRLVLLGAFMLTAGCGYVYSGKWEDDPKNWERAFRSAPPDDVVVVHSQYWRAAHWSYEAGYVFELQANRLFRERLFRENRLRQIGAGELDDVKSLCFSACPTWFAPQPLNQYEIWSYADEPESRFRVLIDKTTGKMFLADFQV